MTTDSCHADEIITGRDADIVLIARDFLRDPYWALNAEPKLDSEPEWPRSSTATRSGAAFSPRDGKLGLHQLASVQAAAWRDGVLQPCHGNSLIWLTIVMGPGARSPSGDDSKVA